jgi:hypothetical protein
MLVQGLKVAEDAYEFLTCDTQGIGVPGLSRVKLEPLSALRSLVASTQARNLGEGKDPDRGAGSERK